MVQRGAPGGDSVLVTQEEPETYIRTDEALIPVAHFQKVSMFDERLTDSLTDLIEHNATDVLKHIRSAIPTEVERCE